MEKKRIALIIPHTDITLETDLQRNLPKNYILHTHRIWLDEVGEEAEKRMVDTELPNGIKFLKNIANYEAAIFGCTSASAVYGIDGLKSLEALLSMQLGCRSISAFGGVLKEIRERRAKKIAMITPYPDPVNKFMVRTLNNFGVNIVYYNGLGLSDDTEISKVEPSAIKKFIQDNKDYIINNADLCFISCTNFRAMEIRNDVEKMLGVDTITSNYGIFRFIMESC
ncbi:hypothetical protein R9X47_12935 [Wukongibacter baidiensis]|uniref:maleate cis-trans isomerase family protein n=1 Tax=Wukongibacter baidiensis TaxID=1723361 RepID=UPI003D7FA34A